LVLSSFGTEGFFKVKSFSGEKAHFSKFKKVYFLKNKEYEIFAVEKIHITHNALLMKVHEIDTPEKVKNYAGCEIWVETKYATPLHRGEYYIKDLCQCNALYNNEVIGEVKAVYTDNNTGLLEIIRKDGKTIMIPFQDHFVGEVDLKLHRIYLREDFFSL
jgi:16S rRNA processing protein RimM